QYVTTKPFKQFGATIEKSSTQLKAEYGPTKYKMIYGDEAWNAPDGKIIEYGNSPDANLIHPRPLPIRYQGPVYLLISAQTFSSAMSCALAAKDYGLATIVGEETGEPVNSTGEVYGFTTPGIGLRAFLTTKVYLAPKPHPNDQGVVPDIAVATTPADIAAGRDPVLDRVLSLPALA
ncbi:MAG TPA: S41 family peptidase, partial [Candidatus Aquilonibacter sp.]